VSLPAFTPTAFIPVHIPRRGESGEPSPFQVTARGNVGPRSFLPGKGRMVHGSGRLSVKRERDRRRARERAGCTVQVARRRYRRWVCLCSNAGTELAKLVAVGKWRCRASIATLPLGGISRNVVAVIDVGVHSRAFAWLVNGVEDSTVVLLLYLVCVCPYPLQNPKNFTGSKSQTPSQSFLCVPFKYLSLHGSCGLHLSGSDLASSLPCSSSASMYRSIRQPADHA
jgi:hypothetical protein